MKKQIIFLTLLIVLFTILGFHTAKHLNATSIKVDTQTKATISSIVVNKVESVSSIKRVKHYSKDVVKSEVKIEEIEQIHYVGPSLFELANELNVPIGNIEEPTENTIPMNKDNSNILSLAELIALYGIKSF